MIISMDQQNIIVLGCLTLAAAISAFILWGPSPRPKKKKGQIVGLVNLGSTCFLNTLLQALASCAVFLHWLGQQKHENNSLTKSLHHVLWVLNGAGTGSVYAPIELLSALKNRGWMVSTGEQDAHELFNMIVSTLQEETNKSLKRGSLSDALCYSDELSQISDLIDDIDSLNCKTEDDDIIDFKHLFLKKNNLKNQLGKGDVSENLLQLGSSSSSDNITKYEDALDKLNHGDSISHSSTIEFHSLEENYTKPSNTAQHCGDNEELKTKYVFGSKENGHGINVISVQGDTHKNNALEEKLKEKSEFLGYFDRVTGCSPCIPVLNYPPFQGLLTSTLQCSDCGHHSSVRYDTFDSVSLPLNDNLYFQTQKLQDLLQKFVKTEVITDVDCEKCCKKTTALKTLNFGKLPYCLCLRIARTAWHSYSRTPSKREDFVYFPEYLPMDDYTISAKLKKGNSVKSLDKTDSSESLNARDKHYKHLYRLKSVVVHLGGINSGHFLTYRRGALNTSKRHRIGKLAGSCMDSQRWYLISDDNVKLSTLCEAMDSMAYMLFYEKCFPESNEQVEGTTLKDSNSFSKDINGKSLSLTSLS